MDIPEVLEVRHVGGAILWLKFDDGAQGTVDIAALIGNFTGIWAPLEDPVYFAQVRLALGSIAWPNDADIDPLVLWAEVTGEPIVDDDGTVAPGYEDRVKH